MIYIIYNIRINMYKKFIIFIICIIHMNYYCFQMLQELYYACDKHMLEFYWDKQYNLFSKISKIEMHNITYRLKNIISNIEKYSSDEFILAKFICKLCFLKLRNDDI